MINNNPWLALQSYENQDIDVFFGRDDDIEKLFNLLQQNECAVLYSASGEGKSSLINAGLIPEIWSNHWFPIKISIGDLFSESNNYNQILSKILKDEINSHDCILQNKAQNNDYPREESDEMYPDFSESPWWTLRYQTVREKLSDGIFDVSYGSVILIFDQFEEVFRKTEEDKQSFFKWLSMLTNDVCPNDISNRYPKCPIFSPKRFKVLISMRYEYVGEFDYWCSMKEYIPSMLRERYFLKPLTRKNAEDVVEGICKHYNTDENCRVIKENMNRIIEVVGKKKSESQNFSNSSEEDAFSALALSLVCHVIYDKLAGSSDKSKTIDAVLKGDIGKQNIESLVCDYYSKIMKDLGYGTRKQLKLERKLINMDDFSRYSVPFDKDISKILGKTQEESKDDSKDTVFSRRLLKTDINGENVNLAFVHDFLAHAIGGKHTNKRKKRRLKIGAITMGIIIFLVLAIYLPPAIMKRASYRILESELTDTTLNGCVHYVVKGDVLDLNNVHVMTGSEIYISGDNVRKLNIQHCYLGYSRFFMPNVDTITGYLDDLRNISYLNIAEMFPNLKTIVLSDTSFGKYITPLMLNFFPQTLHNILFDNRIKSKKCQDGTYFVLGLDGKWSPAVGNCYPVVYSSSDFSADSVRGGSAYLIKDYDIANPIPEELISNDYYDYYRIISTNSAITKLTEDMIPDKIFRQITHIQLENVESVTMTDLFKSKFGNMPLKYLSLPKVNNYSHHVLDTIASIIQNKRLIIENPSYLENNNTYRSDDSVTEVHKDIVNMGKLVCVDTIFFREKELTSVVATGVLSFSCDTNFRNNPFSTPKYEVFYVDTNTTMIDLKNNHQWIASPYFSPPNVLRIKKISVSHFNRKYYKQNGRLLMKRVIFHDEKFGKSDTLSEIEILVENRERMIESKIIPPACKEYVVLERKPMPAFYGSPNVQEIRLLVPYGTKEWFEHSEWHNPNFYNHFNTIIEMSPYETLYYRLSNKIILLVRLDLRHELPPVLIVLAIFIAYLFGARKILKELGKSTKSLIADIVVFTILWIIASVWLYNYSESTSFSMWHHSTILLILFSFWVLVVRDMVGHFFIMIANRRKKKN